MSILWHLTVQFRALSIAFGAALACAVALKSLLITGWAWRIATDVPNARSLHDRPIPRVGGWGVLPISMAIALALAPELRSVAMGALFLCALSQIDDRRGLPARVRFAAHIFVAVPIAVLFAHGLAWWAVAVVAVASVWGTNLYNFMDGSDGLAGGMALFGFGAYALAALAAPSAKPLAFAAAAIAGSAGGFLFFNFHPARIFLGDAGSIPLGFLASALGYIGWREGIWPVWFPLMVFCPFVVDASVTLAKRLARGEKFWLAHREHYYQRMVRLGMGHARTACCWYAAMFAGAALALYSLKCATVAQWVIFGGWVGLLALIGVGIDVRWGRFRATSRELV
jgi:UDP-N-acetylmuramyl pentapeptide phosphotransferase/UDP-N-acetylglucosamine-1-phosphate transferase